MGTLARSVGRLASSLSIRLCGVIPSVAIMPPVVYGIAISAPVRIVRMTCEALGVEYETKEVDLMKGEHMTEEYLKINPQHNIPAMVDGDFKLNESRAIALYLVNSYGKDDKLYPKDPKARAVVDQRLYFDMGAFYHNFGQCVYPLVFGGVDKLEEEKVKKFEEVLGWVNGWVESGFVAGTDHLTVADISIASTLETILQTLEHAEFVKDFDTKYANLKPYMKRVSEAVPNYEKVNVAGAKGFAGWVGPKVKEKM